MEVLPFLLIHLIIIAKLIALPLLYLWIGIVLGKHVLRIQHAPLWLIYIAILVIAPTAWLTNGYLAFRTACNSTDSEDFIHPVNGVDGFYLRRLGNVIGWSKAAFSLVDDHTYDYIEYGDSVYFYRYDYKTKSHMPQQDREKRSKYELERTLPETVSQLIKPYYQITRIRILKSETGEILAQTTEYVYGGGLLGQYFKYLGSGWSNNYESLACGYIKKSPHYFRPGEATDDAIPIINGYLSRDREFIMKTLVPANTTESQTIDGAPNTSLELDAQKRRAAQLIR